MNCPNCNSSNVKKNGHIHNGKQNHQCKDCGRQFVENPTQRLVSEADKEIIEKLLAERISLRGICRSISVSMTWLMAYICRKYDRLPDHLNVSTEQISGDVVLQILESEADEMWSFVGKKENKQWVWVAMDVKTRQIIAFYVGDRSANSAKELWKKIPQKYQEEATFYTDNWEAYKSVFPKGRHKVSKAKTTHIERFFCTVRQRVSRVVRKALSFSKKLDNHIGAIKYFICHYNLSLQ